MAQFREMSLDFRTMELYRVGRPVEITLREFKVLKFLVCRPRIVFSRQKAHQLCLAKADQRSTYRTVDKRCIAKLRQKIESNPSHPCFLQTVRGGRLQICPSTGFKSVSSVLLTEG